MAVIFVAVTIYIIFKGIHSLDVVGKLAFGGLRADFDEEAAAKFSEGDWCTVVGLTAAGRAKEFLEVFDGEILPVSDIITSDNGKDLVLVEVGGDLVEDGF